MNDRVCAWQSNGQCCLPKKNSLVCISCWEAADEDEKECYKDLVPGKICMRKLCWWPRRQLHRNDAPYCPDHMPPPEPLSPRTRDLMDRVRASMDRSRPGPGPDVSGWRSEGLAEFSKACTDELLRRAQGLYPEG